MISLTPILPLIAAVFLASLLGSLHCAGMCAGFMAFAIGGPDGRPAGRLATQGAYHLGRLGTYTVLGMVAGLVGAAFNHTSSLIGFQRGAASLAGTVLVGFGLVTLMRVAGVRALRAPAPEFMRRLLVRLHGMAFELPPVQRAAAVGLLTTLLPCGWLYAFTVSAAGTGSPLWGAGTMAVFWAGTLPMMMTVGAGIQSLTGAMRRRLPVITSIAVVVVGIMTVLGRFGPHHHALPDAAMILPADNAHAGKPGWCGS